MAKHALRAVEQQHSAMRSLVTLLDVPAEQIERGAERLATGDPSQNGLLMSKLSLEPPDGLQPAQVLLGRFTSLFANCRLR